MKSAENKESGCKGVLPETSKIKILIVDDEKMIREFLLKILSTYGHEISCAEDGLQAKDLVAEKPFDLVISDICMPRMDGIQLLGHIQQNFPTIDVLLMTGYAEKELPKAGIAGFLEKPFKKDELQEKLDRIIRARTYTG